MSLNCILFLHCLGSLAGIILGGPGKRKKNSNSRQVSFIRWSQLFCGSVCRVLEARGFGEILVAFVRALRLEAIPTAADGHRLLIYVGRCGTWSIWNVYISHRFDSRSPEVYRASQSQQCVTWLFAPPRTSKLPNSPKERWVLQLPLSLAPEISSHCPNIAFLARLWRLQEIRLVRCFESTFASPKRKKQTRNLLKS